MKIGIGIISAGIRAINRKMYENKDPESFLLVEYDPFRSGPGQTRNRVMKKLMDAGCDYIFVFDDDCYPVMKGWEKYFIDFSEKNGVHFMGTPHVFADEPQMEGDTTYWPGVLGCFIFQTRHCMETIGYYNSAYQVYGFEDSARNNRAMRAGLTGRTGPDRLFALPHKAGYYIHSEDLYHECPTPNLSVEEKHSYIEANRQIYINEISSPKLYYPYEEILYGQESSCT